MIAFQKAFNVLVSFRISNQGLIIAASYITSVYWYQTLLDVLTFELTFRFSYPNTLYVWTVLTDFEDEKVVTLIENSVSAFQS